MYHLSSFKANDPSEVLAFMQAHPFAMLCGSFKNGSLAATQIPLLIEERAGEIFLQGHFMRKQDHHLAFTENPNALAIFTGPHAYISASWYDDPKRVSTWNYQAVHAHGVMEFKDDDWLYSMLSKLTALFENNPHSPSLVEKMEDGYVRKLMPAIIGFEIRVEKLDHVFKLSQNKDDATRKAIISHLSASGDREANATAEAMKQHFGQQEP